MKIVHIGHVSVPPEHPDATVLSKFCSYPGRWVLNLALAQNRHTDLSPEIVMQVAGARRNWTYAIEGIPVHFIATPARFRSATLFVFDAFRLRRVVRRLEADLVHAHGTEDAAAMAAAVSGLPSLVTFQGVYSLMNRVLPPFWFSRPRFQETAERIAVGRLRHAIVKSDYGAREIAALFPHLQLYQIPNTYLAPLVSPSFQKSADEIVFAGTIVPRKGIHFLVRAIEYLLSMRPNLRLHLFGDRADSTASYELEQLRQLRALLGKNLILHGIAPKRELDETLARATAIVAPSLEEMFGNQIIEALLVGTHAVVSSDTPLAENVHRFGNGTVFPMGDAAGLADAIVQALDHYSPQEARLAIAKVEEFMSPAHVATLHAETYRAVLNDFNNQ